MENVHDDDDRNVVLYKIISARKQRLEQYVLYLNKLRDEIFLHFQKALKSIYVDVIHVRTCVLNKRINLWDFSLYKRTLITLRNGIRINLTSYNI